MTVTLQSFDPEIAALIQQNTLVRVFHEALFPKLLFRADSAGEEWQANLGETKIFTRSGRLPVNTTPLVPGTDPTPASYGTEQFRVTASQFGNRVQTHMPTSRAAIASKFTQDTTTLGMNAGETINRICRDRLYRAYLAGDTVLATAALIGATTIRVASLNGFQELIVNGSLVPVSPAAPIAIELGAPAVANTVTAFVPDDPARPFGSGTLTLGAALGAGLAVRTRVRAVNRSRIVRVGGVATVDNLTAGSILTLNDIISAVQLLRSQNVPPHADGKYHVHCPSEAVAQLFQDNHWQRLHQSQLPSQNIDYRDLMIGAVANSYVYENTECPNTLNTGTLTASGAVSARVSNEIGAEVLNETAVPIGRTIVTGGGSMYEEYIPESQYITPAGVNGQVGNFQVTANGVLVMTDRIRYIIRAPQDVLQQVVDQAWSFSGDWAVPSDGLTGNAARFKRAVVIEHAGL